jgi:hypothetical protein
MHTSNGKGSTHLLHGDRRGEFVAVVETLLPEAARRAESAALFAMVATFWGAVMYFALVTFALQ